MYSSMAKDIPASPIRDMMVRASMMEDVVSFAVGDPDFPSDDCIIEAAKASLDRRETNYAPGAGVTRLREVYAQYLSGQVGVPYGVENVIVTVGGMSSLFLGLMALINPGDEVLISAPYFSNYAQMVRMCRGVPVSMDVREEDDFELTADTVARSITDRTRVLMLNSPCNPTGGILTRETLARIAQLAIRHDIFVLSDEVYRHILFDGAQYASIASEPGMAERTMIVDSCSKTFAMTGFRIGFGAGPKELIQLMIKLTEGVHSSTPTTGQWAAIEAFRSAMPATQRMVAEYQRRRDYLYEHLNRMKGVRCIKPKGAFYIFANISGTGLDAVTFSNRLLDEAHVAVVPGDHFGSADGARYIRISYATSMENVVKGCGRMEAFCAGLGA